MAYQSGKSTDTALKSVVSTIEKGLQTQEIALGAFVMEGDFDRTSIEAITSALLRRGVPPLFERWIASMLRTDVLYLALWGRPCRSRVSGAVRKMAFYRPCFGI